MGHTTRNRYTGPELTDEEVLDFVQKVEDLKQKYELPARRIAKLIGYQNVSSLYGIMRLTPESRPSRVRYDALTKLHGERKHKFGARKNGQQTSAVGEVPTPTSLAKPQSIGARLHQRKLALVHERTELTRLHDEAAPLLRPGIQSLVAKLDDALSMFESA